MLYFKQELVSLAYRIIETKENADHIKAWNDLNDRIREDYPLIEELESTLSNCSEKQTNSIGKGLPIELNSLYVDRFGILYSVLLKKKFVNTLKDFFE